MVFISIQGSDMWVDQYNNIMQFSLSRRECHLLRLDIIKVFKVKLPYVLFFQGNPACSDLKLLFSSEDR